MAGPARGAGFAPHPGGVPIRPGGIGNHGQFGNFSVDFIFRPFNNGRFPIMTVSVAMRFVWPWWGWGWGGWGWDSDSYSNNYDNYLQQQAAYNQQLSLQGQLQYMQQQLAEMRHDQEVQRDYAESQAATQAPALLPPRRRQPQNRATTTLPPRSFSVMANGWKLRITQS